MIRRVPRAGETWVSTTSFARWVLVDPPASVALGPCDVGSRECIEAGPHTEVCDDRFGSCCPAVIASFSALEGAADSAAAPGAPPPPPATAPKAHRLDRYVVAQGGGMRCVDCGAFQADREVDPVCAPVPGWRMTEERVQAAATARHDENLASPRVEANARPGVRDRPMPVGLSEADIAALAAGPWAR